jgi:AraC-like DNA-binding protein
VQYYTVNTDDIDELFAGGTGWDQDYLQLTSGPLAFASRNVRLPGVHIDWNSFGQSVLFREVLREPAHVFGVTLNGSNVVKYFGREMAADEGLIWHPGQEHEYVATKGTKSLIVVIAPSLAQALGWELAPRRRHRLPRPSFVNLVNACRDATAIAMRSETHGSAPGMDLAIRDRVVLALRDALMPWTANDAEMEPKSSESSPGFRIVKHAEHLMTQWDPDRTLDVGELAAELEASQRALYEAFRRWLGMGPYEFHLLKKMHAFRGLLVDGEPFHGKIKRAARAVGFRHLGRLTQSYRRHFGESPRETMRRRDRS